MIKNRIKALRAELKRLGIDGFVVPKEDMFMGEYIRRSDERLEWISGFTGSAGFAVITQDRAALFVDSRYTLQAAEQCPDFEIIDWPNKSVRDVFSNEKLGYDPRLLTSAEFDKLDNIELTEHNPIDNLWTDRPCPQKSEIRPLVPNLAGKTHDEKMAALTADLKDQNLDAFISNSPENLAWLMNIRGGEIAAVPAPHVISVIHADGKIELYSDGEFDGLDVRPLETLSTLSGNTGYDPKTLPIALRQKLAHHTAIKDPILAAKAIKNPAEIAASKEAHINDALAFIRFWSWLEDQDAVMLDEIKCRDKLWEMRADMGAKTSSFDTIAGYNAHGAIVHYHVSEDSNASFDKHGLFLLDSGAHYEGATTDITRTLAIGDGIEAAKKPFTLVLEGLADISQARFPKGTSGRDIDALARAPLWSEGLNYGHGTGHGVGAELSVHEGPQAISKRGDAQLEAGMIISLEPGYYEAGAFGIRHENLAYIVENNGFLHFEALTLVPFDTRMIAPEYLSARTKNWLTNYHRRCFETLAPYVNERELAFLARKCHKLDT